jgi:hypothetical protein
MATVVHSELGKGREPPAASRQSLNRSEGAGGGPGPAQDAAARTVVTPPDEHGIAVGVDADLRLASVLSGGGEILDRT